MDTTNMTRLVRLALTAHNEDTQVSLDSGDSASIERDPNAPGAMRLVGYDPEGEATGWTMIMTEGGVANRPSFYPLDIFFSETLSAHILVRDKKPASILWRIPGADMGDNMRGIIEDVKASISSLPQQFIDTLSDLPTGFSGQSSAEPNEQASAQAKSAVGDLPEEQRNNLLSLFKRMVGPSDDRDIVDGEFELLRSALVSEGWEEGELEETTTPYPSKALKLTRGGEHCTVRLMSTFGLDQLMLSFDESLSGLYI